MKFLEQSQYLPALEEIYLDVKDKIFSVLPNARIEHIGSSSIPGVISKGDLDVFIGVDQSNFNAVIDLLFSIGYCEKMDTLRTNCLCMMETDQYGQDVALQIVVNGSEFEFFLEFRNKLRASSALIENYNQLKRECYDLTHDQYRKVKSAFIESVLKSH